MIFYFFFNCFIDQFQITFVPEDGIVTISEANSEDDLITLPRALPSFTEESMALALESPPLPNSMLFLSFHLNHSNILLICYTVIY